MQNNNDSGEALGEMTGEVKHVVVREHHTFEKDCPKCGGTGSFKSIACSACGGGGKLERHPFNYGFIIPDDASLNDVFVHHRDIEPWRQGFKELSEGDKVKFDLFKTSKGLQARNVIIKRDQQTAESFETFGNA